MVLKPMIYEIIVFMVGFYPGSIRSNLYSATTSTVAGGKLPCLNFLVSHSDMIYLFQERLHEAISRYISQLLDKCTAECTKLFRNFLPEDENIQIFNNILVRVTIR
jgi:hypothetical protein